MCKIEKAVPEYSKAFTEHKNCVPLSGKMLATAFHYIHMHIVSDVQDHN